MKRIHKRFLLAMLILASSLLFTLPALAEGNAVYISAPEGVRVTVDGTALTDAQCTARSLGIFAGFEHYTGGNEYAFLEYACPVSGEEAAVSAFTDDGTELTPITLDGGRYVFLYSGSEADKTALASTAENFFSRYMDYTRRGGESAMWGVLGKVLNGSDLYQYINESREAMIFASSADLDYDVLEFDHFTMVGENAFLCTVNYAALCTVTNWYETDSYDIANTCEMLFVRSSGSWYAAAILDVTGCVHVPFEARLQAGADVQVLDIEDGRCKGKVIYVKDPTRVFLGTMDNIGWQEGLKLPQLVEKYQGLGGINAGGFNDENGRGSGGIPQGLVITEGQIVYGSRHGSYAIVGLDQTGMLIIGNMTGEEAIASGIVSGVSFTTHTGNNSALLINGTPQTQNFGPGVNPRTAIGQRSDGSLVLLVLDGRCVDTLGVRMADICRIMQQCGAVNAGNLDGGSSSTMVYNNAIINNCSSCTGPRKIPTAFIVK